MADKLTLLELHLHSEDNEFTSDVQFSSDIGDLLRDRLGLSLGGGSDADSDFSTEDDDTSLDTDDETSFDTDTSFESEPDAGVDPVGADGGGAVQTTDEASDTVVEIDEDVADDTEEESSGSALRKLLVLGLLVGLAFATRQYLGGDDLDDEFAVDDDFGVDDGDDDSDEL